MLVIGGIGVFQGRVAFYLDLKARFDSVVQVRSYRDIIWNVACVYCFPSIASPGIWEFVPLTCLTGRQAHLPERHRLRQRQHYPMAADALS